MKSFLTLFAILVVAVIVIIILLKPTPQPPAAKTAQIATTTSSSTIDFYMATDTPKENVQVTPVATETMVQSTSTNNTIKSMKDTYTVTLKTNQGDIVLELFAKQVPNTVANFVKLSEAGFYKNVKFHRVIKGFMLQGGDPNTKDDNAKNTWGMGGPGYKFADEFAKGLSNVEGTISMANAGPNTNGSQFFINTADNSFLDGKHAVFGKVVKGMDVVQKIENTKTDAADRPLEPVVILSTEIQ
jgi:cyclophilin family peptidyl-prolyl cis-trans isomerase